MTAFFTKKRIGWIVGLTAAAYALYIILPVSVPLIMALLTAVLLEPAVKLASSKLKIKRNFGVLIVFILFVVIVGFSGYYLTAKVASEAVKAVNNVPLHANKITSFWHELKQDISMASEDLPEALVTQVTTQGENFINSVRTVLLEYVNIGSIRALLTKVPNFFVSFLVYLVALFLFMVEIPKLRLSINKHLTERTGEKVNVMFARLSYVVLGFLKAQLLVSFLIFALSLLGLYLIVPQAAVTGAILIWAVDFIPVLGSAIVLVPWALFHSLSGNTALAVQLGLLAATLVSVRYYLEPRMLGNHLRLSPLATLVSMYLGFKLLGITGIVIGPVLIIGINSACEAGILRFKFKL